MESLDIKIGTAEDKGSSFDDLLLDVKDKKAPPPLDNDYTGLDVSEVEVQSAPKIDQAPSEVIVELCGSMLADVSTVGLDDVLKSTITYVDNDNKSVLLVNKYLMSIAKPPIPIIAPGLAPKFLQDVTQMDVLVGDIVLYENEDGANLGILIAPLHKNPTPEAKVLTTQGATIQMSVVPLDNVHSFMR